MRKLLLFYWFLLITETSSEQHRHPARFVKGVAAPTSSQHDDQYVQMPHIPPPIRIPEWETRATMTPLVQKRIQKELEQQVRSERSGKQDKERNQQLEQMLQLNQRLHQLQTSIKPTLLSSEAQKVLKSLSSSPSGVSESVDGVMSFTETASSFPMKSTFSGARFQSHSSKLLPSPMVSVVPLILHGNQQPSSMDMNDMVNMHMLLPSSVPSSGSGFEFADTSFLTRVPQSSQSHVFPQRLVLAAPSAPVYMAQSMFFESVAKEEANIKSMAALLQKQQATIEENEIMSSKLAQLNAMNKQILKKNQAAMKFAGERLLATVASFTAGLGENPNESSNSENVTQPLSQSFVEQTARQTRSVPH